MARVHAAPGGTVCAAPYGAPPEMSGDIPSQESVQDTSLG